MVKLIFESLVTETVVNGTRLNIQIQIESDESNFCKRLTVRQRRKNDEDPKNPKSQKQEGYLHFQCVVFSSNCVCESRQEAERCCEDNEDDGVKKRAVDAVVDDLFAVKLRLKKDTHKLS